jgi:hypothetical protein
MSALASTFPIFASRERLRAHLNSLGAFSVLVGASRESQRLAARVASLSSRASDELFTLTVLDASRVPTASASLIGGAPETINGLQMGSSIARVILVPSAATALHPFLLGELLDITTVFSAPTPTTVQNDEQSRALRHCVTAQALAWAGPVSHSSTVAADRPGSALQIPIAPWSDVEMFLAHLNPHAELLAMVELLGLWRSAAHLNAAVRRQLSAAQARLDFTAVLRRWRHATVLAAERDRKARDEAERQSALDAVEASAKSALITLAHLRDTYTGSRSYFKESVLQDALARLDPEISKINEGDLMFEADVGKQEPWLVLSARVRVSPVPLPGNVFLSPRRFNALRKQLLATIEEKSASTVEQFVSGIRRKLPGSIPQPARVNLEKILNSARARAQEPAACLGKSPFTKPTIFGQLTGARAVVMSVVGLTS